MRVLFLILLFILSGCFRCSYDKTISEDSNRCFALDCKATCADFDQDVERMSTKERPFCKCGGKLPDKKEIRFPLPQKGSSISYVMKYEDADCKRLGEFLGCWHNLKYGLCWLQCCYSGIKDSSCSGLGNDQYLPIEYAPLALRAAKQAVYKVQWQAIEKKVGKK